MSNRKSKLVEKAMAMATSLPKQSKGGKWVQGVYHNRIKIYHTLDNRRCKLVDILVLLKRNRMDISFL